MMAQEKTNFDWGSLTPSLLPLQAVRKNSRLALVMPVPLALVALWAFGQFMEKWWIDPFIDAILLVFLVGQFMAIQQHRLFLRGVRRVEDVLQALVPAPRMGLAAVIDAVRRLPDSHLRDLVVRISQPLQSGDRNLTQSLLDSAANRRGTTENRRMGQQINLNRSILKLGFIGTLIGLLLTFPPMKEAMLSLIGSEGELKFVKHIADAIDGDRFAIFATLIATGLSLLIELATFQMLEYSYNRFEAMNNLLEEWLLTEACVKTVSKDPQDWNGNMAEMQTQMHRNLVELADMVRVATRRIEDMREVQDSIERRQIRLSDLGKELKA